MEKLTESDTCRKFVVPKLVAAGWDNDPHSLTGQGSFGDTIKAFLEKLS
jgi:type I restriction enzyme R subunit